MITALRDSTADQHRQNVTRVLVPQRRLPAWLLSCTFHAGILVALALMVRTIPSGAEVEPTRTGGIVLVSASQQRVDYLSEDDVDAADSEWSRPDIASTLPDQIELPPELPGLQLDPVPGLARGSDFAGTPSVEGEVQAPAAARDFEATVTTEVFGVKGTGSRFVYVFDRSASMDGYGGGPLRAAKTELIASLQSLDSVHQFQIMFYNDQPEAFNPTSGRTPAMLFATEKNKRGGERFVRSIDGTGGTDHVKALKMALSLGPDVVFLLTDAEGGLTAHDLGEIRRVNRAGTVINTIEFGVGGRRGRDRSLETLARQNRGQYVYKDIQMLGD